MRMQSRRAERFVVALGAVSALLAGCAQQGTVITGDLEGRRVEMFEVEEPWLVYAWSAAQTSSRPTHLVARDLRTNGETELEANWKSHELALDQGRVAYWMGAIGGSLTGDIVLYDLAAGSKKVVGHGRVTALDLSGEQVVWSERSGGAAVILKQRVGASAPIPLSEDPPGGSIHNREPRISGPYVVWTRFDASTRENRLCTHDLNAGKTTQTPIGGKENYVYDLSGNQLVYRFASADVRSIRVYDVATGQDREIVQGPRLSGGPAIANQTVAWYEDMPQADFKPIAGQPLIDHRDFRTLYRHDLATGKTRKLASDVFGLSRPFVSREGRIYATAPRGMIPAGQSNLVVPVDLRRW